MNIEEKFANGKSSHTYQRIDAKYQPDIFLGYNDDGQMSMSISEFAEPTIVKSTKFINVSLRTNPDGGKLYLYFDLLDDTYKSLFLTFCSDIIDVCCQTEKNKAISKALVRWQYWKNLFGKKKGNILEQEKIKGLIGELIELRDHFLKDYDESTAVSSWMGPLFGHKDFEINDTWYEIKSINEAALQIHISSLEQLESDIPGHLVVVRLEEASSVSDFSINLNQMVSDVISRISDLDTLNLFQKRLENMGYVIDDEYNKYNYIYKGKTYYKVHDGFPRIRRNQLHRSIGNVKYSIMIDGISEFKEN